MNKVIHPSMKGHFGYHLHKEMRRNPDIWVVTSDLGHGLWDRIREDFPNRFINCGAAEACATGIAVGLAMMGKIPILYSITPFLIYRPFETIRNYINREEIPVKLIGAGRDTDYEADGFSHHAHDVKDVLSCFTNIAEYWPETNERMETLVPEIVANGKPTFVSLRRK